MASIIIDEILPTKWRLRLRDTHGKTREVDYRAGTPLELGAEAADEKPRTREKPEAPAKKQGASKEKAKAEKPSKETSAKERTKDHAHKKPEASPSKKSETPAPVVAAKAEPEPPKLRRRAPDAGTGPGELVWEAVDDDGVPGIRAPFARGAFKILHAGGDAYGLFYEWSSGKYQTLSCGTLESLKQTAATWTGDGQLKAPRSNLGAEVAKVACAAKDELTPPPAATTPPTPAAPAVDPAKDKVLMEGFEATVQKLLAAKKGSP